MAFRAVEFKAFDGITLRGDLFLPEQQNAPIIIMTHGLTLLKEQHLDNWAREFQKAGIASLIYDHRSYGDSDGEPRSETNIWKQVEDSHDAVSYVRTLSPTIDPTRIALWGIGHSGGMSMVATALDPRVKAAVLMMPFTSGASDGKNFPWPAVWANREALSPEYIAPWPTSLESALDKSTILSGKDVWEFIEPSRERTRQRKNGQEMRNALTLQSFYHISRVNPRDWIHRIAPRAVLYMAATVDGLTGPIENHREVFGQIPEGGVKEFYVMDYPHLKNYFGEAFEKNAEKQVTWLTENL